MSAASSSAIAAPSQSRVETNSRGIPHAPFIVSCIPGATLPENSDPTDLPYTRFLMPAPAQQSNVHEYLGGPDEDVEPTLKKFQETMSKYKFMELNTAQRRRGLEDKIPDIRKTLQMVHFLQGKKDEPESIETTFELNDTLYAKARLDPVDTVHLWLGVSIHLLLRPRTCFLFESHTPSHAPTLYVLFFLLLAFSIAQANVMLEYPLDEAISLLTSKLAGAEKSLTTSKEDLDFLREQITIMEVNTARVHNWDVKRRRERREQLEREGITPDAKSSQAS